MTPYEEGFAAGARFDTEADPDPPIPPPARTMRSSFLGGMKETKESIQRTEDWREWSRGWSDGLNSARKSA